MSNFLTIEDVNGVITEYYNVPFWDTIIIDTEEDISDFTDRHYDYLTVSRQKLQNNTYKFIIVLNNDLCRNYYCFIDGNNSVILPNKITERPQFTFTILCNTPDIKCMFYLNDNEPPLSTNYHEFRSYKITDYTKTYVLDEPFDFFVEFEALNPNLDLEGEEVAITFFKKNGQSELYYENIENNRINMENITLTSDFRNQITIDYNFETFRIYLKQFKKINIVDVPNDLKLDVSKSNTFNLISESDNLKVECDYPVTVNNKQVNIDLSEKNDLLPFDIKVITNNDSIFYLNEFNFRVPVKYPTISSISELNDLFDKGGIGKLGVDLTFSNEITLKNDVYLIGNDKNLNLDGFKIIISENKIFKAENTTFENGINIIQQKKGSTVELTNCNFNNNIGVGSVIKCEVDITSLDNPTDFTTIITDCTFTDNEMCILHGGNLTITDCTIVGRDLSYYSDDAFSFPYFLYQTDGNAVITGSNFRLEGLGNRGVKFTPCIFTIGEYGMVNNMGYNELSQNNVTNFLTTQRNSSVIDVSYYYAPIEDNITLQSDNGYCHSISGIDYVFKTNITLERGD